MSAATDGFSAMMSFLAMRRERPQMLSAKADAVQPLNAAGRSHVRAWRVEFSLVGEAALRPAEELFGYQLAGRCLLIPEHHQHDQLELLDGERSARSGERALDDQFAVLRRQDSRLLERDEEAAAPVSYTHLRA